MHITLVQPFTDNIEPPLSLAFLAGPLKQAGHQVRLIDLQIPDVQRTWKTIFYSEPVDIVGITAMTPQIKEAHSIAQWIKSRTPKTPVIVGGVHATLLPEQTLHEFQAFDIVVIGEGEETILELVSTLEHNKPIADVSSIGYRSDGDIRITPARPRIQHLDALPNPHEHYDFDFYLENKSFSFMSKCVSMIVSRGCPYSCRFCATTDLWTNCYIHKSTDGVIKEIRYVLEHGAKGIVFRDSTFNINRKWVEELCEKILKEKLRFKWAMNARVNLVNYESTRLMKKAGLDTVYVGVESGSQKILDFYGKGITLEQTEKAFRVCRKLGINTGAYFMLGALPELREDMEMTYQFVKKLKPTFSLFFLFMPLPGSELYKYYLDQGYRFDYNDMRCDKAVFSSAGLTPEELEATRAKWELEFNKKSHILINAAKYIIAIRSGRDIQQLWKKAVRRFTPPV